MAPPRRRQRMNARIFLRRGDAQGVSVQMLDKRGREVQIFFCNAQSKSSARSASQKKGTHGLKLYVTTMTTSSVCPMCETVFFSNLATPRVHVVQAFQTGRCFVNRSARAYEWDEKAETQAPFLALTQNVRLLLTDQSTHALTARTLVSQRN